MNQKRFLNILLIVIVFALTGAGVYLIATRQTAPFKPRPTPAPNGEKIIKKVGEIESGFLIQKINQNSIEGIENYSKDGNIAVPYFPRQRTLRIGNDIGVNCAGISEKLISINFSDQTITFNKVVGEPPIGGCPICLAGNSLINTPSGLFPVKDLKIGMPVWTTDKIGKRVSGVITKISKVLAPPTHQMVRLILDDGRELFVSPGHPTIDGRAVGDLLAGNLYDNTSVISAKRVTYGEEATYDILPSGDTGFYWANGILMSSTLR